MNDDLQLGKLLGAREAFGMVAGRCSAADATILRDIRDGKKYLNHAPTWDEFCEKHLHISKGHANRLIRYLNDLGPNYFTLAQLTHITPDEFRKIRAHMTDNGLEYGGEAIALIEQNTERLTSAVSALRQSDPPTVADTWQCKLDAVEERVFKALRQLELLKQEPEVGNTLYRIHCRVEKMIELATRSEKQKTTRMNTDATRIVSVLIRVHPCRVCLSLLV
jgi:hypothetical protein